MARGTARWLLPVALALAPTPLLAAGEPLTAETAIEVQRGQLRSGTGLAPCPTGPSEDIIVCGRRDHDRERHPFPDERLPGDRTRLPGEPPTGRDALAATKLSTCTTTGPNQSCGGGLPVIPIAFFVVQSAIKAVKGRD